MRIKHGEIARPQQHAKVIHIRHDRIADPHIDWEFRQRSHSPVAGLSSDADEAAGNGEGLAFLADESASPTRARLVAKLKTVFPRAIWAEYEPVQDEPPVAAAQAAFGRNVKPLYRFAAAKRIVSLDADFFHGEAGSLYYAREFGLCQGLN